MPCLELKVPAEPCPHPVTRLRALLEKTGAAILRRNFIAETEREDGAGIESRIRLTAVLAVDLTNPPAEPPASPITDEAAAEIAEESAPPPAPEETETASFARGLEIWVADGLRTACIFADEDEIPGALAMFNAYQRLARYQPAFNRLDQRIVGLTYGFREGLTLGVQGAPSEAEPKSDNFFDLISPISEIDDFRSPSFTVRLPNGSIGFVHELFQASHAWLQENSYPNILGSK